MEPQVFQRDDKVYIVAPVSGFNPGQGEIEQFAFADQLKETAPNEHLMWLRGHYVEADNPNRNGQEWTAGELALKHLTPRLMPVTVMHDPSTAVGLIADAKLATPDKDGVPRSRLDTTLAVWKHRFPEIAEECAVNYNQGTLMQSMECIPGYFECVQCGATRANVPGLASASDMCEHMAVEDSAPVRRLGNVVFTGTGLIFGTRGSRGAYDEAHLDVFQDEVAEFHSESHQRTKTTKRPRSHTPMDEITISKSEYAELQKRPSPDDLAAAEKRATDAEEAKAQAEKDLEAAEAAQKTAEEAKAEAEKNLSEAEEAANAVKLSEERMAKLGAGFVAKLGDKTKARLTEQSKSFKDEDWSARLDELAELVGVKPDEGASEEEGTEGEEFSREEVASAGVGNEGASRNGGDISPERRRSLVGGLID